MKLVIRIKTVEQLKAFMKGLTENVTEIEVELPELKSS